MLTKRQRDQQTKLNDKNWCLLREYLYNKSSGDIRCGSSRKDSMFTGWPLKSIPYCSTSVLKINSFCLPFGLNGIAREEVSCNT